jgi:hypothetical protein
VSDVARGVLRVAALVVVVLLALALTAGPAGATSPDPSPPAAGGDPRSEGQGPGLVGQPLLAIGGVVGLGLVSLVATVAYVRLTDRRGPPR